MSIAPASARSPSGHALQSWPGTRLLAAAATVAAILFYFAREPMARGWLAAFIPISQIALGGLALLLIDRLTGTRWAAGFRPYLTLLSAMVPALVLLWIPAALNLGSLYVWAANVHSVPEDVAAIYLNPAAYSVRSLVSFAGWTFFALLLLKGWLGRLAAAVGLLFYGASFNLIAFDWILSTDAPFASSAFGAEMAVQNIMAALAAAGLFAARVSDVQARRDLGSFLMAVSLAILYFALISYIVNWYGDLPGQAEWYLRRSGPWAVVIAAAAVFGSIIPIVTLLFVRVRQSVRGLRLVAASALLGIILHDLWHFAPLMHRWALACFLVSFIAAGVIALGLARLVILTTLSRQNPDG
ncbi:MAG: hypothetical protein ACLPWS_07250 [Rhodomicrobium sp.]